VVDVSKNKFSPPSLFLGMPQLVVVGVSKNKFSPPSLFFGDATTCCG